MDGRGSSPSAETAQGDADTESPGPVVADDPLALVLLGLRLRSLASPDRVAELVGLSEGEATARLAEARDAGWARYRDGRFAGWVLTDSGRIEGERRLAHELDQRDRRAEVHDRYRSFVALNSDCLQVCTDWQVRNVGGAPMVNDHSDPDYDATVIARLDGLVDGVRPVHTALATVLARFGTYDHRFEAARRRVKGGEFEWFTRPDIDSFHTVWFELHEHLLATLGIPRSAEDPG